MTTGTDQSPRPPSAGFTGENEMKPTEEVKAIARKTEILWNPEGAKRTGWYKTGEFIGNETRKVLERHYSEMRLYFTRLARVADHEDWSISDQELFDAVRELEKLVVPEEQQLLNDNEAFWCGLGGPYQQNQE